MKAAPAASRNANERPKVRFRSPPLEAIADAVEKAVAKRTSEIEKNAEKRVKQAEKRAAEAMPRRVWYGPDKMRAAYLAGQGKSGEEIARIIGGTTAPRVRTMLHGHDIPLMRNGGHDDYCLLKWKKADRELIEKYAAKRERDPAELAALLVRKIMQGGDKAIDALVSEFDVIG